MQNNLISKYFKYRYKKNYLRGIKGKIGHKKKPFNIRGRLSFLVWDFSVGNSPVWLWNFRYCHNNILYKKWNLTIYVFLYLIEMSQNGNFLQCAKHVSANFLISRHAKRYTSFIINCMHVNVNFTMPKKLFQEVSCFK